MTVTELRALIANGENSSVECKRDDVRPAQVATAPAFEATEDDVRVTMPRSAAGAAAHHA